MGLDPSRLAVVGDSVGGNMVAAVTLLAWSVSYFTSQSARALLGLQAPSGRIDDIKVNHRRLTVAQHGALVRLRVSRRWLALRVFQVRADRGTSTRDIYPDGRSDGNVDLLAVAVAGHAAICDRHQDLNRRGVVREV